MPKRMQSPSSINLYKQCPRRYFYQYILKLPTKPSIHLVRGNIVHTVLEKFFALDVRAFSADSYKTGFSNYLTASIRKEWNAKKAELGLLGLRPEQLSDYLTESCMMLQNWLDTFSLKLDAELESMPLPYAFRSLTPRVEERIVSERNNVQGFIDVVEDCREGIYLMDYKTSKKDEITPGYRLQLAIYALLYLEKYSVMPRKVGIHFLKFKDGIKLIDADDKLVRDALFEVQQVHLATESSLISDYPKCESGLCRWSGGQCDFYDRCVGE